MKKKTVRIKELTKRLITFSHKSWEYICKAIENLKSRYRRHVSITRIKQIGAGLCSGTISVA